MVASIASGVQNLKVSMPTWISLRCSGKRLVDAVGFASPWRVTIRSPFAMKMASAVPKKRASATFSWSCISFAFFLMRNYDLRDDRLFKIVTTVLDKEIAEAAQFGIAEGMSGQRSDS